MRINMQKSLKLIAGSEGGYSNNKNDPGGPTMKGVTLANYQRYCARKRKPKPSVNELKMITDLEVAEIFDTDYWKPVHGDELPAGLDYCAADFGFNSGPGQAIKELQRVVTLLGFDAGGADGKVGNGTLSAIEAAVAAIDLDEVINAYMNKRWAFMQKLKNFPTFKNGWKNRIADVRRNALMMASGEVVNPPRSHEGGNAKADPVMTKTSALAGGTSTMVTVGGAVATGVTTAATKLLDTSAFASTDYLPWAIGGFIALTLVGSVITYFILKGKPAEEGTV